MTSALVVARRSEFVRVRGEVDEDRPLFYRQAGRRALQVTGIRAYWSRDVADPTVVLEGQVCSRTWLPEAWRPARRREITGKEYAGAPARVRAFVEGHVLATDGVPGIGSTGVTVVERSAYADVYADARGEGPLWRSAASSTMRVVGARVHCQAGQDPWLSMSLRAVGWRSVSSVGRPVVVHRGRLGHGEILEVPDVVRELFEEYGPAVQARANALARRLVAA